MLSLTRPLPPGAPSARRIARRRRPVRARLRLEQRLQPRHHGTGANPSLRYSRTARRCPRGRPAGARSRPAGRRLGDHARGSAPHPAPCRGTPATPRARTASSRSRGRPAGGGPRTRRSRRCARARGAANRRTLGLGRPAGAGLRDRRPGPALEGGAVAVVGVDDGEARRQPPARPPVGGQPLRRARGRSAAARRTDLARPSQPPRLAAATQLPWAPSPSRTSRPPRSTRTTRPTNRAGPNTPSGSGQLSPRTTQPCGVRATTRCTAMRRLRAAPPPRRRRRAARRRWARWSRRRRRG